MFAPLMTALQDWTRNFKTRLTLGECDQYEVTRMARDLGVSPRELAEMSRLGPHAADLLSQRMAMLHLDPEALAKREPGTLRDMQRLCSACISKKRCQRELAGKHGGSWRAYCPNAGTFEALQNETTPVIH